MKEKLEKLQKNIYRPMRSGIDEDVENELNNVRIILDRLIETLIEKEKEKKNGKS